MPEGILGTEIDSVYASFNRAERSWSVGVAGPDHVAASIAGLPGESFGNVLDAAVVKLRKHQKSGRPATRAPSIDSDSSSAGSPVAA